MEKNSRAEEFDDMGYPLNMTRFSYQKEETEAYPNGQEILSYSIYFGDDWMFNLNSALFYYDDERVQRIVDDLNEALQDSIKEIFQRLLWKSQRPDSLDVMLRGEDFGADGINLRKRIEDLIDLREINFTGFKKDTKREAAKRARRIENEIKGVLPKGKSYKVDKPKWFKIAQTGIVMGVAGLVGYAGFKNKE